MRAIASSGLDGDVLVAAGPEPDDGDDAAGSAPTVTGRRRSWRTGPSARSAGRRGCRASSGSRRTAAARPTASSSAVSDVGDLVVRPGLRGRASRRLRLRPAPTTSPGSAPYGGRDERRSRASGQRRTAATHVGAVLAPATTPPCRPGRRVGRALGGELLERRRRRRARRRRRRPRPRWRPATWRTHSSAECWPATRRSAAPARRRRRGDAGSGRWRPPGCPSTSMSWTVFGQPRGPGCRPAASASARLAGPRR